MTAKQCPICGAENSAIVERCACGYQWRAGKDSNKPPSWPSGLRRLLMSGFRMGAGPLKFKLFQFVTIALVIAILACGVGFMEARDSLIRKLFAVGFLVSFIAGAIAIVWLREKMT